MNLWESWYINYEAAQSTDEELLEKLTQWSAQFVQYFVLGGYAPHQSPFPLLAHEALTLLGFLYRDDTDIESLLQITHDFTDDGQIQIPVQWLAEPVEIARIHTVWAHEVLHGDKIDDAMAPSHFDLDSLPPEEQICQLLDTAEYILELGTILESAAQIRVDTWAKLLYADKMLESTAPLLAGYAGVAATRFERQENQVSPELTLENALTSFCRIDQLINISMLIQGPPVDEIKAGELAMELALPDVVAEELARTLEKLYHDSNSQPISSTFLSDSQRWLEGMLHTAKSLLYSEDDILQGDSVDQLNMQLEQATALARIDAILSDGHRDQIRSWAARTFEE